MFAPLVGEVVHPIYICSIHNMQNYVEENAIFIGIFDWESLILLHLTISLQIFFRYAIIKTLISHNHMYLNHISKYLGMTTVMI